MLIGIQAQHNMRFLYRNNVEEAFVNGDLYYRKERIVIALSSFCLLYTTQKMDVTIGKLPDKLAAEGIKEMKCLLIFFGFFEWKYCCVFYYANIHF